MSRGVAGGSVVSRSIADSFRPGRSEAIVQMPAARRNTDHGVFTGLFAVDAAYLDR